MVVSVYLPDQLAKWKKNVFANFCSLPNVKVRLAQFCAKALTTTSNFTPHEKCGDENSNQKTTSTNIFRS